MTPSEADARLGGGGVDLFKMDIEGAEAEFFADVERCRNLLARTRAIAIEVHPERVNPHQVLYALDECGVRGRAGSPATHRDPAESSRALSRWCYEFDADGSGDHKLIR